MSFLLGLWHFQCILVAFVLVLIDVSNANTLVARQSDGATGASAFLRRGYHASLVVGDYVYIDGGEFATYDNGKVKHEFSNTLLSIDLSKNWTNSTVTLHSTSKPTSVPSLVQGGLWYDSSANLIYTGFAGRTSFLNTSELDPWPLGIWTFKPDGLGSGTWGTALESTDSAFDSITRPHLAAIAHGNGVGYALGGSIKTAQDDIVGSDLVNLDGMLRFDMATKELTNVTVEGPRFHNGHVQHAQMVYVPNFGPEGVFVVLGGVKTSPQTDAFDWGTVTVFDPKEGKWYDQETTGNTPLARKEFCTAGLASDNKTYEIFVYAGWGGDLGTASIPYDQIYILTLPAFHWIKVDYTPTHTRHALTCHPVGGGQILTIGGVNSASEDNSGTIYQSTFDDKDEYTQGLAIFDLSTLEWKDQYNADASPYTQSSLVRTFYSQKHVPSHHRRAEHLLTSNSSRNPVFNSTQLKTTFDTTNFTKTSTIATTGSSSPSAAASTAAAQSSNSLSKAAIAGIAVGAVAGALALIGGLVFLGCARSRRAKRKAQLEDEQNQPFHGGAPVPEMHGLGLSELPPEEWRHEMQGERVVHEKHASTIPAELPADEAERRKSGRVR